MFLLLGHLLLLRHPGRGWNIDRFRGRLLRLLKELLFPLGAVPHVIFDGESVLTALGLDLEASADALCHNDTSSHGPFRTQKWVRLDTCPFFVPMSASWSSYALRSVGPAMP